MKKLFLFDIDGTIAVDETLYDGTKALLEYICGIGGRSMFITNNSTKSRMDYVRKFNRWQIPVKEEDFVTASYAACIYLQEHHHHDRIFVAGTKSFVEELKMWGFDVTETVDLAAKVVLIGFDNELTYQKVEDACSILVNPEVVYLATNPDLCCPTSFGSIPDCGAICQMIGCAAKREPLFLGKPNPVIVDICLQISGFTKEETLVVGDRLYTDIAVGIRAGVDTAVVFTGEATPEDCRTTEYKPNYQFEDVSALLRSLKAAAQEWGKGEKSDD